MVTIAAVITGKGTGAISTIQIFGDSSQDIINKIFKPKYNKKIQTGMTLLGAITDGKETIDEVIIGCEADNNFSINCHGNPLIVSDIMKLLEKNGAKPVSSYELLSEILKQDKELNIIAIEAKLVMPQIKTFEGAKLVNNQIEGGLNAKASGWQKSIDTLLLEQIKTEAEQILKASAEAKYIIYGCRIILAGAPNTGKSTLLNYLAGKEKAIVTDIKGTTRDWVSIHCQIGAVYCELIDTAGLDEKLSTESEAIEETAQQTASEIIGSADLVLLVLDLNQSANQLSEAPLKKLKSKKIITVLNKSDLPRKLDETELPKIAGDTVKISAKLGTDIDKLTGKIQEFCGIGQVDLKSPVCFTKRQERLLERLRESKSKEEAHSVITELLNGEVNV